MRHWSTIVTAFYILAVAMLVSPLLPFVVQRWWREDIPGVVWLSLAEWAAWSLLLAGGPLVLLGVTVAGPRARPRPRRHILVAALAAGGTLGVLVLAAAASILFAIFGDQGPFPASAAGAHAIILGAWVVPWLLWTLVFWRMGDVLLDPATRLHRRFVAGSVLELLIAVPSHVITRVRNDCCAPAFTGWAIAFGLAVLLMSLGPGVLFLYRARMRRLRPP